MALEALRVTRAASHKVACKARAARALAQEYELRRGEAELSQGLGAAPLTPAVELQLFRELQAAYARRCWEKPRLFVAAGPVVRALRGGQTG